MKFLLTSETRVVKSWAIVRLFMTEWAMLIQVQCFGVCSETERTRVSSFNAPSVCCEGPLFFLSLPRKTSSILALFRNQKTTGNRKWNQNQKKSSKSGKLKNHRRYWDEKTIVIVSIVMAVMIFCCDKSTIAEEINNVQIGVFHTHNDGVCIWINGDIDGV